MRVDAGRGHRPRGDGALGTAPAPPTAVGFTTSRCEPVSGSSPPMTTQSMIRDSRQRLSGRVISGQPRISATRALTVCGRESSRCTPPRRARLQLRSPGQPSRSTDVGICAVRPKAGRAGARGRPTFLHHPSRRTSYSGRHARISSATDPAARFVGQSRLGSRLLERAGYITLDRAIRERLRGCACSTTVLGSPPTMANPVRSRLPRPWPRTQRPATGSVVLSEPRPCPPRSPRRHAQRYLGSSGAARHAHLPYSSISARSTGPARRLGRAEGAAAVHLTEELVWSREASAGRLCGSAAGSAEGNRHASSLWARSVGPAPRRLLFSASLDSAHSFVV